MTSDMTGRPVRKPGDRGERWREAHQRRARASEEEQEKFWAERFARAETPLQLARVAFDLACTAVVKRERRAAVAWQRARGSAGEEAARRRLELVRREITVDLDRLTDELRSLARRHRTSRV